MTHCSLRRLTAAATIAAGLLMVWSCKEDSVETMYSRYGANFSFYRVQAVPALNSSLNGYGQYCAITRTANDLVFAAITRTDRIPLTDLSAYRSFQCIDGFIVGKSNTPEPGQTVLPLLAYDRVCPNCYETDGITRPLGLKDFGRAKCDRCRRVYDLNNLGLCIEGDPGISMFRYRVTYDGCNVMAIQNRPR